MKCQTASNDIIKQLEVMITCVYHVMFRLWLSVGRIEEIETYWSVEISNMNSIFITPLYPKQ